MQDIVTEEDSRIIATQEDLDEFDLVEVGYPGKRSHRKRGGNNMGKPGSSSGPGNSRMILKSNYMPNLTTTGTKSVLAAYAPNIPQGFFQNSTGMMNPLKASITLKQNSMQLNQSLETSHYNTALRASTTLASPQSSLERVNKLMFSPNSHHRNHTQFPGMTLSKELISMHQSSQPRRQIKVRNTTSKQH